MFKRNCMRAAGIAAGLMLGASQPALSYVNEANLDGTAVPAALPMDSLIMVYGGVTHYKDALAKRPQVDGIIGMLKLKFGLNLKVDRISRSGLFVLSTGTPLSTDQYIVAANYVYANYASIKTLQPNFSYQPLQAAGRYPRSTLWNLRTPAASNSGSINAQSAWPVSTGAGITVAIIDSGVRAHPQLTSNFVGRWAPADGRDRGYPYYTGSWLTSGADFTYVDGLVGRDPRDLGESPDTIDPLPEDRGDWTSSEAPCRGGGRYNPSSWHGTHVAGIAAGAWTEASRWSGVAPDARILPVRALAKCGGDTAAIVDAIRWAGGLLNADDSQGVGGVNANPARVINMSLGMNVAQALNQAGIPGTLNVYNCTLNGTTSSASAQLRETMMAEQMAISEVVANGTVVVVAAGNDRTDASQSAPAGCANVIAVGAVRPDGRRSNYSNFTAASSRSVVDVMAPGGEMSLTYASASAEPATLPTGVLELDMWGNPTRWGYLHAEAEYCAQREAYVSPTTWSGWTPVRELYQGAMRWICVNAAANWRSPVFVRRDSAILSTVKSGASVYGDTFGVFESQAGRFDSMVGTSMAAPHVAGVVALMLARNPALTPALVEARLKASARSMTEAQCKAGQTTYAVAYARGSGTVATSAAFPPGSAPCGAGMVDAAAAVNAAALPL